MNVPHFVAAALLSALPFTLASREAGPRSTPPSTSTAPAAVEGVEQIIYVRDAYESLTPTGAWTSFAKNGVTYHRVDATEPQDLLVKPKGTGSAYMLKVPPEGEAVVATFATFVDLQGQDRIRFESTSEKRWPLENLRTPLACDGVYSNVRSISFSGTCWGPLESSPETGIWEKPCSGSTGSSCSATIVFTDGSDPVTPNFGCAGKPAGREFEGMKGNTNQKTASAHNADSSC